MKLKLMLFKCVQARNFRRRIFLPVWADLLGSVPIRAGSPLTARAQATAGSQSTAGAHATAGAKVQGGSDKSGIFKVFFKNQISQLNITQIF